MHGTCWLVFQPGRYFTSSPIFSLNSVVRDVLAGKALAGWTWFWHTSHWKDWAARMASLVALLCLRILTKSLTLGWPKLQWSLRMACIIFGSCCSATGWAASAAGYATASLTRHSSSASTARQGFSDWLMHSGTMVCSMLFTNWGVYVAQNAFTFWPLLSLPSIGRCSGQPGHVWKPLGSALEVMMPVAFWIGIAVSGHLRSYAHMSTLLTPNLRFRAAIGGSFHTSDGNGCSNMNSPPRLSWRWIWSVQKSTCLRDLRMSLAVSIGER